MSLLEGGMSKLCNRKITLVVEPMETLNTLNKEWLIDWYLTPRMRMLELCEKI